MNSTQLPDELTVKTEDREQAMDKWQYLIKNNQELDESKPLANAEIEIICQILSEENKTRPVGLAQGEFAVPDDFNDSLPEDILDSFYQ